MTILLRREARRRPHVQRATGSGLLAEVGAVKDDQRDADLIAVALGISGGARLLRASYGVVRKHPALLWYPVISTVCLAVVSVFWVMQGAYLFAIHGPKILLLPLVLAGLYSVTFVGIFFSVALAGAAAEVLDGSEASFNEGIDIALNRLGGIAGWAAFSLFVSFALSFVDNFKSLRWLGAAAKIAWNVATIFVIPMIAIDDSNANDARARSFQLAKENWRAESGGLGVLKAALLVPALLFFIDARLLFEGHMHSLAAKTICTILLVVGLSVMVAANVVRQVFAVSLYRASVPAAA